MFNILVTEDDANARKLLRELLKREGYIVFCAVNGNEALEVMDEQHIDLIVLDIMMPEMDGYEAIEKMKNDQELKDIPVIAITAQAMTGDREKCMEAGADGYISKPVDVDELLLLLNQLID